ncbi:Serine/threonine-protein kinase mph1 [Hordeum vulgare]|nr:Serine/threonine-protein kinase mph1 [Hordeum vulgare]
MEAAWRKIKVEEKEAIVNKAHALLMLGICRPVGFSAAAVGPASTGSSVARSPHCHSLTSRTTAVSLVFPPPRHDAHTRFSGSSDVSVIAPAPHAPRPASTSTSHLGPAAAYDPDETQSQDGHAQFIADEEANDRADYDHGDSWHGDDNIYCEGDEDEVNDIDISGEPLFIDELTQRAEQAFQSSEAFKARHNDKPFTLTHCWTIINDCPKFKDQYRELQRRRGKKTAKFAGSGDGEELKRPRGQMNSKVDDIHDAASMALHETLHGMMSQKDKRDEKKRQSKDEQMKQYLELQRKKLEMEEEAKKRKIDLEEVARQRQLDIEATNVEARKRQLDIEATNAATKVKEVSLAIMRLDLTKMSEKTRSWFEARQKEMFDADGMN